MKFAAVLSSAAVAAAAAISKSEATFDISNFSAGCIPHSLNCLINFQVTANKANPSLCKALVPATNGALPTVNDAGCTNSTRTFDFVRGPEGFTFSVTEPATGIYVRTSSRIIPNSEFEFSNTGNARVEGYTGPSAFALE
ncbi:hypothetical protein CTA2_1384 [Colletotrichum tanaceti]|uniref:Hypersensitive response-inducing protein n=1 Tax=Colletotrichum tanaceti TaxID=1306861 RepID=A0A4V6Y9A4_9PEZI|nr:hypothetical protein CTA2_1384 [Colletotrichum tanaceti]TKW48206.1 hypothetical protein CTA1_3293 [Colletotrichum tanaceti]